MLGGVAVQLINADALIVFAGGLKEIATTDPFPAVCFTIVVVVAVFLFIMLIPTTCRSRCTWCRRRRPGARCAE